MAARRLLSDSLRSARLWRVWTFLGLQDIKSRFRRSVIGPVWLLLYTAFFVAGAGVFYGLMFAQPVEDSVPFLTAGIVIWTFLLSTFTESGNSFIAAEGYIKQFSFPKQIYLLRSLVVYSVVLGLGLAALVPVQLYFHRFTFTGWLMALPGVVILFAAALGHIAICAYLSTRFRDLPHAMTSIFQVLFFVTPIMFPAKLLAERRLDFVYQFNPLYYLIDVVRHPILEGEWAIAHNYAVGCAYVIVVWLFAALVMRWLDDRVVFLL